MVKYFIVLLTLIFSINGFAQTAKSVNGNMIDLNTKRTIDGIEVQLVNKESEKIYTAVSDDDGKFDFKNIPLGV